VAAKPEIFFWIDGLSPDCVVFFFFFCYKLNMYIFFVGGPDLRKIQSLVKVTFVFFLFYLFVGFKSFVWESQVVGIK
jgi:hypothetical protein